MAVNPRIGRFAACCLVAICGARVLPATTAELDDLLVVSQVQQQVADGNIAGAIAALEMVIRGKRDRDVASMSALILEIARLYRMEKRYEEAGEAFAILADLVARKEGPTSPRLGAIHGKAAESYREAGNRAAAIRHFEDQLEIDRRYLPCESRSLVKTLQDLAGLLRGGNSDQRSQFYGRLASDEKTRCEDATYAGVSRGVIVKSDFSEVSPDSFTRVAVYYATDRAPTGSDRIDDFYGAERGALAYGRVDVTVPRSHKPGAVEAPSLIQLEWSENPERHIVITRLETLAGDTAMERIRATLDSRDSDEILVFVHGYNVTFSDAAKRTAQIAYDLNFDGVPFLYSWPSRGSALSYISDEAVVRLGGRHLLQVLETLLADSGARRIHLVAHSMGNRALTDALELMAARQEGAAASEPLFEQVLFTAPDVDAGLFAAMIKRIRPIARRLTLYASENDLALSTSRKLHGAQPRAGQAGADILVSQTLDTIDMSDLGEDMLGHSYFASDTSALSDMLWLMWRDEEPKRRCGMRENSAGSKVHWRFDPANCNGGVALSALTLVRGKGEEALEFALAMRKQPEDKFSMAQEWRAIADMIRTLLRQ